MRKIIPVILVFALVLAGLPDLAIAQNTCGSTFIVRSGDTFSGIAAICGVSINSLLAANPNILQPDLIFPGQVINIPPSGPIIPPTGGTGNTYTVVNGDTLWSISQRFNITLLDLTNANPAITNIDFIFPGQVINIPPSGPIIPPTGGSPTYYTINAGDTLYRISVNYNTTVSSLLSLNPWITNENYILPGWVIRIT